MLNVTAIKKPFNNFWLSATLSSKQFSPNRNISKKYFDVRGHNEVFAASSMASKSKRSSAAGSKKIAETFPKKIQSNSTKKKISENLKICIMNTSLILFPSYDNNAR